MLSIVASLLVAAVPLPRHPPALATWDLVRPGRSVLKSTVEWWSRRMRAWGERPEPPLRHLAASQVGYGPGMQKRFTSAVSFRSFRVLRDVDGSVVFEGGPARTIDTDVLGDLHRVWIGDFTPVRLPGRYRIVADNGLSSYPFDVGTDVFDRPLRAVQRAFYFQRAFTSIEPRFAEGPWVHASDADNAPPGVVKGWHDAGDFTVYNGTVNVALFWMLETFSDFAPAADDTNIPESGNGIPDLLDEARWGLEWLLSVQDGSGGFRNTTCQDRYGAYGTNTPNSVPPYRDGEVGTIATARAIGTLAYASVVFRAFDVAFAERCLAAARDGYRYLEVHAGENTDGPSCPAGRSDGDAVVGRHVRMYAAAGMLLATGQQRYRDDFDRDHEDIDPVPNPQRMSAFAARLYLRAPAGDPARKRALVQRIRTLAEGTVADGHAHPFELAPHYYWGSIADAFSRTGAFNVKLCIEDPGRVADCEQALASVHYAFGRNFYQYSYVAGIPGVTRGMTSSFHHWLKTLDATPHDFPGMIAGGPSRSPESNDVSYPAARPRAVWGYFGDPAMPRDANTPLDGRYTDNDSWSTNEMMIVGQAVALYGLHHARWMARRQAQTVRVVR